MHTNHHRTMAEVMNVNKLLATHTSSTDEKKLSGCKSGDCNGITCSECWSFRMYKRKSSLMMAEVMNCNNTDDKEQQKDSNWLRHDKWTQFEKTMADKHTADKIAQLEAEISKLREGIEEEEEEISIIDEDEVAAGTEEDDSLHEMEYLIQLWEARLAKSTEQENNLSGLPDIPNLVYVSSMETDLTDDTPARDLPPEDRNPAYSPRDVMTDIDENVPPRPRNIFRSKSDVTNSYMMKNDPVLSSPKWKVLEQMIEERDNNIKTLNTVIYSDTDMIKKMKDTLQKLVLERKAVQSNQARVEELESKLSLQEEENKALEAECERLLEAMLTLDGHSSSQENTIAYLKSEMVNMLLKKQLDEEATDEEIEQRDTTIANLKNSFTEEKDISQKTIKHLGAKASNLEDQVEELRAENVKLRIHAMLMQEDNEMKEKEMQKEMQLLYIETSRHEIL